MLTYIRYTELGGTLPENRFYLYEQLASYFLIDLAGGDFPGTEVVETAIMLLIDAYDRSDSLSSTGTAASYSNDGVSVSYQQYETPESIIALAQDRAAVLFANAGIYKRSLAVRHRE